MADLEEEFWGSAKSKGNKDLSPRSIANIKFFLTLLFSMAIFLWIGFQTAFLFPLEKTEARLDESGEAIEMPGKEKGKQIILVLGRDNRDDEPARTDTILLTFLDSSEKTVQILNIPRDTYGKIVGKGIKTKINHAFAYGGVQMTIDSLEELLDVEIDRHIDIDFKGFASLVEALGGITLDVEKRMYYPAENINLQKGEQKLNGEDALAYVRYRDDVGDLGRVERQQKFLRVLADQVLSLSTIWKIPKLVGVFQDNVNTDLSLKEMASLGNAFKSFSTDQLETIILPGEPEYINGISYFIVDRQETAEVIDKLKSGQPLEESEELEAGMDVNMDEN